MNLNTALTGVLCMLFSFPLFSQNQFWTDVDDAALRSSAGERWIEPEKYRSLSLDFPAFSNVLKNAPLRTERNGEGILISLPLPDGSFAGFSVKNSPVLTGKLAEKNPGIQTFSGQGVNNPSLAVYLDVTPLGFHAMIIGPRESYFIDPYFKSGTSHYVAYDKGHFPAENTFSCGHEPGGHNLPSENMNPISNRNPAINLKTYRIAVAATGEYTAFHGSAANALAAITTTLNRVRGVYETELAISFTLVPNNNLIIYDDPATDPYSDTPTTTENQTNIDNTIGAANYDLGHLVDQGGNGGIAGLAVVCRAGQKAKGITGHSAPTGDPYDIDYVAHEIGHQFGADHTFNGTLGSCAGNRNASTAYEPNGGSTIMAYSGICSGQNIQFRSNAHFHLVSIEEITNYVTVGDGSTCPATSSTGNNPPTVNANAGNVSGKYIPINTPFELTASGTDPDGHSLFYCWEQWDLGAAGTASSSSDGPIFRSFHPAQNATRTFPRLSDILDNSGSNGEFLPATTRDLNFKCTVRDGQVGGGATASDQITIHVTNSAADFAIASQNTSAVVNGNITINWNVGNTTAAPVNCANVDVYLSLDGGENFTLLKGNTPNDGSESVTLPNSATGQARLKVKCADNVFFDINNADLRIAPGDATCAEQVTNGNFASGNSGWTESWPNNLIANFGSSYPGYSNATVCWLGFFNDFTSSISQTVTVPAGPHFAKLSFWYKLGRFDCGGDEFRIKVNGVIRENISLCNNDAAMDWKRHLIDLSAYAGTSPTIEFELVNDTWNPTDFFIDEFSLHTCQGGSFAALPVELLDFQVIEKDGGALLTWETARETNNRGFEIEHQNEDGTFQKIAFVAGAGTVHSPQSYRHFVPGLSAGAHFFRLRQMDTDGGFHLSPVRSVRVKGEAGLHVFPNPVRDVVFFELDLENESHLTLDIFNSAGQPVRQLTDGRYGEGHFKWEMDVQDLPTGVYFYLLRGEGFGENGRFLVE